MKKATPALLFSAIFVALSFLVMLIPLALFNVALVAAMLGKRTAFLMMLLVSFVLIVPGFLFANFFLLATGIMIICAIPFFMIGIALREKKKPWIFAALVLLTPLFLSFSFFCFVPPQLSSTQFEQFSSEIEQKILQNKQEFQKSIGDRAPGNAETQVLNQYDKYIEQYQNALKAPEVHEFLSYSSWQRMFYFVFGYGSSFFLLALLTSFANVILLDFGFEQIERLEAIINYASSKRSSFPSALIVSLFSLPLSASRKRQTPLTITHHTGLKPEIDETATKGQKPWLRVLWKPLKPENTIVWQGYLFSFVGQSPWNLRRFSLPFPLALLAVLFVGALTFWKGNYTNIIAMTAGENAVLPFIGVLSLFAFGIIAILALQGIFTVYKRVSIFFILTLVLTSVIFNLNFFFSAYTVLALFGGIGLLDYVYDWRGRNAPL